MDNNIKQEKSANKSIKDLIAPLAFYGGASIIGPLVIFGFSGWWLDKIYDTKPFCLLGGIFIAFVITNFFIIKQAITLAKKIELLSLDKKNEGLQKNGYDDEEDLWPSEKKDKG